MPEKGLNVIFGIPPRGAATLSQAPTSTPTTPPGDTARMGGGDMGG